jgi:hypothetical protein
MGTKKNDILQGTLVLLILKSLASNKRLHGYAITTHIQQVSAQLLRVEEGSLYPALHRLEQEGWVRAEWGKRRKRPASPLLFVDRPGQKAVDAGRGKLETAYRRRGARPWLRVAGDVYGMARTILNVIRPAACSGSWNANSRFT